VSSLQPNQQINWVAFDLPATSKFEVNLLEAKVQQDVQRLHQDAQRLQNQSLPPIVHHHPKGLYSQINN